MSTSRRNLLAGMAMLPVAATAAYAAEKEPKQPRASRRRQPAKPLDKNVDVAIVGAGAIGAWTAWHLVRAGLEVRLFDAYGAGNGRAASSLPSMLLDPVQAGDPLYAAMAAESLEAWNKLSSTASLPIVHRCDVAITRTAADAMPDLAGTEAFSGQKLRQRLHQIGWRDDENVLISRGGAMLAGRRGVLETIADAQIQVEDVVMPAPIRDKKNDVYALPDGGTARSIVYASGAWLSEIFPQTLTPQRLSAARQQIFHFGPGQGDIQYRPPALPALIDRSYGYTLLPDLEGQGVRCWRTTSDASVDPDSFDRRADERALAEMRQWLASRIPGLAAAPAVASAAAHDCRTSTGDLLLDRFTGHDRAWVVGGGAGRAFALAPAIGARVAAHVANPARPIEPRWALARLTGSAA